MSSNPSAYSGVATVEIQVDEFDNITYRPSVLHVTRGQQVKWSSRHGHFALTFISGAPFSKSELHSDQGDGVFETAAAVVAGPVGVHHYQSAIFTGRKVLLTAGCPEIIVD
jgi:plastocyanin